MEPIAARVVKQVFLDAGFEYCGIAPYQVLSQQQNRFEASIAAGYHARMGYLARNIEKRFDPATLLGNCQSVIVVLFNYYTGLEQKSDYKISKYGFVRDYHRLLEEQMELGMQRLLQSYSAMQYRCVVDRFPISEKSWAVAAGCGFLGKNGLLVTPLGSFFNIGIILINQKVDQYDTPVEQNQCGTCTRCIDHCPTKAIVVPYHVDAERCLSYQTLSNKKPDYALISEHEWLFGCDVCQDVCPHNKKIKINELSVQNSSLFLQLGNRELETMSKTDFDLYFKDTPFHNKYDQMVSMIKHKIEKADDRKSKTGSSE